jgi:hypothetical protein
MTRPIADHIAHVRQMAKAFDIRWIESDLLKPDEALAINGLRVVLSRPITEETSVAVVLHEFGHLAGMNGLVQGPRNLSMKRVEEEAAWNWARHHALEWTPMMEAVAQACEATYHVTAPPPPPAAPAAPPAPVAPTPRINWEDWK